MQSFSWWVGDFSLSECWQQERNSKPVRTSSRQWKLAATQRVTIALARIARQSRTTPNRKVKGLTVQSFSVSDFLRGLECRPGMHPIWPFREAALPGACIERLTSGRLRCCSGVAPVLTPWVALGSPLGSPWVALGSPYGFWRVFPLLPEGLWQACATISAFLRADFSV